MTAVFASPAPALNVSVLPLIAIDPARAATGTASTSTKDRSTGRKKRITGGTVRPTGSWVPSFAVRRRAWLPLGVLALLLVLVPTAVAAKRAPRIQVLSNRADLVSGGGA